jgi:hypothetical protein
VQSRPSWSTVAPAAFILFFLTPPTPASPTRSLPQLKYQWVGLICAGHWW